MPVRLTNHSRSLLTVTLNSGESVHLAPDESSQPLAELEVDNNPWVKKLLDRHWLAVTRDQGEDSTRT
ncbi:MAG: hypothetical protein JXB05_00990 [Myxococcaceae bacterium]|nr:hypothetical protein [Myxococcaceae bacterium]